MISDRTNALIAAAGLRLRQQRRKPTSAVAIIRHGNKYLMGLGKNTGDWRDRKWVHPGGHVKHGEDAQAAAIREAREETGIECTAEGQSFEHDSAPGVHFVPCRATGGAIRPNHEFHSLQWLHPSHLPMVSAAGNQAELIRTAREHSNA